MTQRGRPDLPWVALLIRITAASSTGRPLPSGDTAAIGNAVLKAVSLQVTLEKALGLPPQWRSMWRRVQRDACVKALSLSMPGKGRRSAEQLHQKLTLYRSSARYAADLVRRPEGDRFFMAAIIVNNGGRVPTEATLRRSLAG